MKNIVSSNSVLSLIKEAYNCRQGNSVLTSQETIPYLNLRKDGIAQIENNKFSIMIEFKDINYQLAQEEVQRSMFIDYCKFLNSFDHEINFQMLYLNLKPNIKKTKESIMLQSIDDNLSELREEYSEMLQSQFEKGTSGLIKRKFVIATISADNRIEATNKLSRIENDMILNFKNVGVFSHSINGYERLEIMHSIMNKPSSKFNFDWKTIPKGASTKDYIAPRGFNFNEKDYFKMGSKFVRTDYLTIEASQLSDRILEEFLNLEAEMIISFHVCPVEQSKAIKKIKSKGTSLDAMKINENKKAAKGGYDMDIMPPDLSNFIGENKKLLGELEQGDERYFEVLVLFSYIACDLEEMKSTADKAKGIAQKHNCTLFPYEHEQEKCFKAILPLGINDLYYSRGLLTCSLAVFVPFTTQVLYDSEGLYYGLNSLSNSMLMLDRKKLENPNGLVLGLPGFGKTFSVKREITNVKLVYPQDDIIISDPESEYSALVVELGGVVIPISATSKFHLNPLDINENYSEEDNPVTIKVDFIMSFLELVCQPAPIDAQEKSMIDRCVKKMYMTYFENPIPSRMPILKDLYDLIVAQGEKGIRIAESLELYTTGSQNTFNHRTNVNISNSLISFDIKGLGKTLKKIGMLVIQDQVWNRVTINRNLKKHTWFYQDEFHLILKDKITAAFAVEIYKRFRKWGGIPTGITQNVKDLLMSPEIENIFENCQFYYLLCQGSGDKKILAEKLEISESELEYITNTTYGEGLLKFGATIVPFKDKFPTDTKLYQLMTSKLEEVSS